MMLSAHLVGKSPMPWIIRGKAGQIFSMSFERVRGVQQSRRSRRRGDPKITLRHRRHTWASNCHASIKIFEVEYWCL
jgi:hypothetical protein